MVDKHNLHEMKQTKGISALITPAITLFLGYLIIGGYVVWSGQLTFIAALLFGGWLLFKR